MENHGSLASLLTYSFSPGASMNHVDWSTNKSSCRQTCVCNVLIQLVFASQSECENAVAVQWGGEWSGFNYKKWICKKGFKWRNRTFTFWQYDMLCTNTVMEMMFPVCVWCLCSSVLPGVSVQLNPLLTCSFPKQLGLDGQFLQGWHEDKHSHTAVTHAVTMLSGLHCTSPLGKHMRLIQMPWSPSRSSGLTLEQH